MALTGVMGADFSAFTDAVDRAEVKLRSFESGAAKVENSLSKMGNAFSGQKVIQDATLMAKIFEEMGGAAAFTEKELARMNATATEAAAKLKAMGQDVPEGIQRIANETKSASKETESWGSTVKSLALQFGALFTVRAAVDFVKDITAQAGALNDLSAQTRISVEELQVLQGTMKEFGVEGDQVGKALFKLSKQIAGGDESVEAALSLMGLSLEKVRGMKGEELFVTIQDGLSKLQGGLRDTVAIELYGEKLGMVMSGASEGAKQAIADWREHNKVMSEENVKALDAAGEAYDRLVNKLKVMASGPMADISKGLTDFITVAEKADYSQAGWARTKDAFLEVLGREKHYFDDLAKSVGVETGAKTENKTASDQDATAHNNNAAALEREVEALKKKKEAAKGYADFVKQTEEAEAGKLNVANRIAAEQEATARKIEADIAEAKRMETKLTAGKGYVEQMGQIAKVNKEAADFEKNLFEQQGKVEEENQKLVASWGAAGAASSEAGEKALDGATQAAQAQGQLNTQINLTIGNVREWIMLQQYSLESNALLNQNSLFTTSSTLENQARLASKYTGIPAGRAAGGPVSAGEAYVVGEQGPELFIPHVGGTIAAGGGPSITNIFHLVDTESNLARRVSEQIMRQVRAGTQLATT